MGKMIAPQSLVLTSTATGIYGNEGGILSRVLLHSIALAGLMEIIVLIILHALGLLRIVAP